MKKGTVRQATDDSIIQRMRIACWIPNATNVHSEYVILIAFARQNSLHERASFLRLYVHCVYCLMLNMLVHKVTTWL